MALALHGTAEGSELNSGAVTLTHPANTLENDVVVVSFAVGDDNVDYDLVMTTASYNELADLFADDTDDAHLAVFWKRMGSTPDSTAVTTSPGGGADCSTAAVEQVWRGVDITTAIDQTTTTASAANSSIPNSPSITTVSANTVVISCGAFSLSDTAITAPTNYINQVDINSADTEPITVGMASRAIAAASTAEDPGVWSGITDTATCGWCAASVCLRPQLPVLTAASGTYTYTGTTAAVSKPPSPVAALNTNVGLATDTTYLIRTRVESTGIAGSTGFRWAYNHNGGGDTPVTTTSTHVKAVAASTFANDADVREVLGGTGTYLVDNNAATEDGTTTLGANFPASGAVEFVLAFQLDSANVTNGQTGTIRLETSDGADLTYTNTFTYTVGTGATLTAEAGAYTLTGTAATLRWDHKIPGDIGAYTLTGTDAGLFKGYPLTAETAAYAITGTDATLRWDHDVPGDIGAYTLTGTDATLTRRVHLVGDIGAYSLTGTDATLTHNQAAITLTAESGAYVLTGTDATLRSGEVLAAEAGSYALTGTAAALQHNYYLAGDVGGYILSGTAAILLWNHVLAAEIGAYTLTGQDATLTRRVSLNAEAGAYTLTGTDATLSWQRGILAEAGDYFVTGHPATLSATGDAPSGGGWSIIERRRRR